MAAARQVGAPSLSWSDPGPTGLLNPLYSFMFGNDAMELSPRPE